MKIAHINYIPYDNQIGVNKKIEAQAKAAIKVGLDIDFIILNSFIEKQEENLIYKKINESILIKKLFRFNIIDKYVELKKYDYLILRYSDMDFSSLQFIFKYGNKVITEHHTDELAEILTSNSIFSGRYLIERFFAPLFLKKSKAFIGVTNEIINVELNKCKCNKKTLLMSNGADVESIKFTKFKPFDGKELNIIFVASFFASWHGLNKILDNLISYKGNIIINLYLIGDLSKSDIYKIKNINHPYINIYIKGRLYGDELDKVFAISTIAISTKKMIEACALKTREYIARGIPFIYGYKDVDLNGDEKFALKIDEFDINQVIEFAKNVSMKKDISFEMREFAKNNLDWKIKMNKLKYFIGDL